MVLAFVESDSIHVVQGSALRRANVVQNSASRRSRSRFTSEPEALERQHAEMIFEQWDSMVGREDPIIERSLGESSTTSRRARSSVPFRLKQRRHRGLQKL